MRKMAWPTRAPHRRARASRPWRAPALAAAARVFLVLAAALALAAGPPAQGSRAVAQDIAPQSAQRADIATLKTASGLHTFTVEIADDPIERARGLMFREEMARDHGMLFDFAAEGPRSFWMKNTPLPLDIIFIRADGTVVSVASDTTPFSTDPIPSEGPARFVLEVNAGIAQEIGLMPGDTLSHPRIAR